MSDRRTITKAAGTFGAATLVSRVFGFIRDAVVANYFGASGVTDIFFVAFRIPNMLRMLLGEGAFTSSFIPVYTDYLNGAKRDPVEAERVAAISFNFIVIVLLIFTLAGVLLSPWIVSLTARGFLADPAKYADAVTMTRLCFPYIFFAGIVAFAMGYLNTHGHYLAPALSPTYLNLGLIAGAVLFAPFTAKPVYALAYGALLGGLAQAIQQIPYLRRFGFSPRLDFHFRHPAIVEIMGMMGPQTFGLAITQINVFVNTLLASYLEAGSISYLYYADRLVQLPLGVFAVALGMAVLPTLAKAASKGDDEGFSRSFIFALRTTFFISIPAMIALIILREPLVRLLFERGAFTHLKTLNTSDALLFYAFGLWASSGVRIVVPAFYSLKDTRTTVKVSAVALLVNLTASLILIKPLGFKGLAIATAVSSTFNFTALAWLLGRKNTCITWRPLIPAAARTLATSLTAGLAMAATMASASHLFGESRTVETIALIVAAIFGIAIYLVLNYMSGSEEMQFLKDRFKNKTVI